ITDNYLIVWSLILLCFFIYIFKWDIENLIYQLSGKKEKAEISHKEKMKEKISNLQNNVSTFISENPELLDEMERKTQQKLKDEAELLKSLSKRKPP
ncbi:hypothetical protein P5E87_15805, partial [Clostridium perfringens]|nr:hypothetical protein [Clostridium perfringens]